MLENHDFMFENHLFDAWKAMFTMRTCSAKISVDLIDIYLPTGSLSRSESTSALVSILCLNYLNLCLKILFSALGKVSLTSAMAPIVLVPTHGQPGWSRDNYRTGFDFLLETFEFMLENHAFTLENRIFSTWKAAFILREDSCIVYTYRDPAQLVRNGTSQAFGVRAQSCGTSGCVWCAERSFF